ncbi:MAG: TlyA family RNA methyltransferase [Lachnospiraceae bacterium]|nr:TlyA family RNA methyltransferase [Lachnospiraceae bacterium]
MKKERLDVLVTDRGLAESRTKAQALIMSGQVYVNGQKEEKSGTAFPQDAVIEVRGSAIPYVSRGGLKLEKALRVFDVSVQGKTCMDVGASTGGFTDCMLQNGAAKVYAVDVGYGQFSWKLRQDPRVVCLEKTNVRYITAEQIPEPIGFAGCDVSFISLTKVLPPVRELLADGADMVCLIKPQFEAGREKVGKKGVVRDPDVHREVIGSVIGFAAGNGFSVAELSFSPIRGPEGNIEYLVRLVKSEAAGIAEGVDIESTVRAAHDHDWGAAAH